MRALIDKKKPYQSTFYIQAPGGLGPQAFTGDIHHSTDCLDDPADV
uniref:Uncharacterized protein n=1 Tax=Arundo donax TaxID=35708 RepID=A0A0A8Z168_ARUDO